MKDIPVFTTDNGVASLALQGVPIWKSAYIKILSSAEPFALLEEHSRVLILGNADPTADSCKKLAEKIILGDGMNRISLSMNCFKYDALLKVADSYKDFVLRDIENIYTPMLDGGTGTVWETVDGESDFYNAGSLCHGWSAMPVYYYYTLLGEKQ